MTDLPMGNFSKNFDLGEDEKSVCGCLTRSVAVKLEEISVAEG